MEHLLEALRQQIGARLLAANSPRTEHGDLSLLTAARCVSTNLANSVNVRVCGSTASGECTRRHLVGIARIQHHHVFGLDQRIPVLGPDVGPYALRRIGAVKWERDDGALEPNFESLEGMRLP